MTMLSVVTLIVFSLLNVITPFQDKPTPTPRPETDTLMPTLSPTFFDETLASMESDWEAAIEELQDLGLIENDGELLFSEEMAIEAFGDSGGGESTFVNVVMGGLISVRENADGSTGGCTFITRGVSNRRGEIVSAAGVVITSLDEVFTLEQVEGVSRPRMSRTETEGEPSFYNPVYVIVLVKDQTISVWADGQPIVEAWELIGELPDGAFDDPVTTTVNPEPGCVMTGHWAYGF